MTKGQTSKIASVALLGLVLAGCGGDSEPKALTEISPSIPSTSASPAPSSTVVFSGATGDFTKKGTQLKLGEKALVPAAKTKDSGTLVVTGTLGVTVTGIKKGDPAELAPLELGDRVAGLTPYYITFVVTNESGTDFAFTNFGQAGGLLADGSTARGGLGVTGNFSPCPNISAPEDFTTKGATYTTCVLAAAGGSSM